MNTPALRWPAYPYPGLRPFRVTDEIDESLIFYGRDAHKDEIIARLGRSNLVMVLGPSGCGKSSLIKAGVIPALEAGFLARAGERWRTTQMRPDRRPLAQLARAFADLLPSRQGDGHFGCEALEGLLRSGASGLWLAMDEVNAVLSSGNADPKPPKLLLLVDQFEEIFGPQIENQDDVDWFVRLLVRFFEKPHADLFLVLTMRTGYIGRCADFTGLAELVNRTLYLTPVLRESEIKQAIEAPPVDYRGEVEPALVKAIIADMGTGTKYDSDNLPLMQHALLWLWLRAAPAAGAPAPALHEVDSSADRFRLLAADYRQHGGLRGILKRHAEDILTATVAAEGEQGRQTAEIVFRRLCERDAGARYRRSPATMAELCRLTCLGPEELGRVIRPFADPTACFIELRPSPPDGQAIPGDTLVDISHESLIRQWPLLRAWADAESGLRRDLENLTDDARLWAQTGGGSRNTLRDDALVSVREWLRDTELYRRTPEAFARWATRYIGAADESWAKPFGGPAGAVEELYRQSVLEREKEDAEHLRQVEADARAEAEAEQLRAEIARAEAERQLERATRATAEAEAAAQRWRTWLVGSLATVAVAALLVASVWYGVSMAEQRRLTEEADRLREVADLHASALANSNLEFGRLPPPRRTAIFQELAVSLGRIEQLRREGVSADIEERLRTLEQSVDGAARQILEAMLVAGEPTASPSTQVQWDELVKSCVLTIDAGKSRDIKQVALLASRSGPGRPTRQAFVVLSRLKNVPTLEVVYRRTLPRGRCTLGMDGMALSVPAIEDVAMDPSGRWLIERPHASAGTLAVGPRIYRLNWFQVCERAGKDEPCGVLERRWRVEAVPLGQYPELADNVLPVLPAGIPAPKPIPRTDDLTALIQPPSPEFEIQERPTDPSLFDEIGGSELYWQGVRLSSRAQAGYRIPAYARRDSLVGFVVSARAADARRPRADMPEAVCGGGELCQHVLRVVRLVQPEEPSGWIGQALGMNQGQSADPTVATIPVAEVQFIGPPISGIGFGTGSLENELVIRFAETGEFATVSLGGAPFRRWFCESGGKSIQPAPLFFSQAFRNYVKAEHGDYGRIGAVVEAACR